MSSSTSKMAVLSITLCSAIATAGDRDFASDASSIERALSNTAGDGTAGIKMRSITSRPSNSAAALTSRGLARVKTDTGVTTFGELPPSEASVNLSIEFDFDSDRLRPVAYRVLDELGRALGSDKLRNATFYIGGHTDSQGMEDYNMGLSFRRAGTVRDYLVARHGIAKERLTLLGFGESTPIASNTSESGRQQNRRVEILKIK